MKISDSEVAESIDRIARTYDGAVLYRHLQQIMFDLPLATDPSVGALHANFGRRSLARDLMLLMSVGIDESGGRTNRTDAGKPSDSPVVIARAKPVSTGGRESFRDYAKRTDPELAVPDGSKPSGG